VEPPSGADPDHRPYEGQATAVCDGPKLPGKVSNLHCGGQGPEACQLADPALSVMQNRSRVQALWACASGRCRPRTETAAGSLHNATS